MKAGQAPAGPLAHVSSLRDLDVIEISRCTTCRGVCVCVTKTAQMVFVKKVKEKKNKRRKRYLQIRDFEIFEDYSGYIGCSLIC